MKRVFLSTLAGCMLAAGCGGGSDGGPAGNVDARPSSSLKITAANAANATGVAYEAALMSTSLGDLSADSGLLASGPGDVSKLDGSFGTYSKTGDQAQVPIPPQTEPCAVNGSLTISGDIEDPFTPTLTAGDFFIVDFDSCDDGLGEITDGMLDFVVDAFSGDFAGGLFDLTMTLTLTDLQVTTADDVITSNGGASISLNTLDAPAVSTSVSGTSLTIDSNSSSETLTNFVSNQAIDAGVSPSPYALAMSGTLDSTQLSGIVSYSTPVTFEGFDLDYPGTGEFLVEGDNSSARLIAIDNVNVRIEVDTDGNGTVDETINTTWAELTAS